MMLIEQSPTQNRIQLIEYMRGIAALSVAWFHLTNQYLPDSWVRLSGSLGWLGVDVFFVISGFVIPLSIARSWDRYSIRDFPTFLFRRLVRLEPPYIASVMLTLILWKASSLAPGFQGSAPPWVPIQLFAHFLYMIPLTDYGWLQPVYWTLAWEFIFYIILGISFPLVGRANRTLYFYSTICGLLLLTSYSVVPYFALLFVIGIAIYWSCLFKSGSPHQFASLLIIALAFLVINKADSSVAVTGLVAGATIYLFKDVKASGNLNFVLLFIGRISYSLYLTHVIIGGRVINLGRRFIEGAVAELLLSLLALLISILFAWIFFEIIEKRFVVLAKRCVGRSH